MKGLVRLQVTGESWSLPNLSFPVIHLASHLLDNTIPLVQLFSAQKGMRDVEWQSLERL